MNEKERKAINNFFTIKASPYPSFYLCMSYDHAGFKAAQSFLLLEVLDNKHFFFVVEKLISQGNWDYLGSECESYQIYDHNGEIVFDSKQRAA